MSRWLGKCLSIHNLAELARYEQRMVGSHEACLVLARVFEGKSAVSLFVLEWKPWFRVLSERADELIC